MDTVVIGKSSLFCKLSLYPEYLPNYSNIDRIIEMEEVALDIYKSKSSAYKDTL